MGENVIAQLSRAGSPARPPMPGEAEPPAPRVLPKRFLDTRQAVPSSSSGPGRSGGTTRQPRRSPAAPVKAGGCIPPPKAASRLLPALRGGWENDTHTHAGQPGRSAAAPSGENTEEE